MQTQTLQPTPTSEFQDQVLLNDLVHPFNTTQKWRIDAIQLEEDTETRERWYHDHVAISNSDLNRLLDHPRTFYKEKILGDKRELDSTYIRLGNMIEAQLLEPSVFDERYILIPESVKEPTSAKQKDFCADVISGLSPAEAFEYNYSTKRKSEEKIQKDASRKYESLKDYIELQKEVEESGKTPYSSSEQETMLRASSDALGHQRVRQLLDMNPDIQVPVFFPMMSGPDLFFMRGLLDMVIETENVIISIDLKTTSKRLSNFGYHYINRGYHRQQAMYRAGVQYEYGTGKPIISKVIVVSTKEPYGTMVRTVPNYIIDHGLSELKNLLARLSLHMEHGFDRALEEMLGDEPLLTIEEDLLERSFRKTNLEL